MIGLSVSMTFAAAVVSGLVLGVVLGTLIVAQSPDLRRRMLHTLDEANEKNKQAEAIP